MLIARRVVLIAAALVIIALARGAHAQIAPPRTIDELKAETQARADRNAYPLIGIKPADAREALADIKTLDRDEWAAAWSKVAARYETDAKAAEAAGRVKEAQESYLTAWRLYSFARWPTPNSPGKQMAYAHALDAFAHYASLLDPAPTLVRIPFEGKEIVGWLRLPEGARAAPRKGDASSEQMFSRALDYVATRPELDPRRVVAQGVSWSGYWAAKLGIVERERLRGVVVQGGPIHHYFQPEWQTKALGTREYLFDLFAARASVYGVTTLDEFLAYGPKLSLKAQGLIDKPSAPILRLNGDQTTQVPSRDMRLQ